MTNETRMDRVESTLPSGSIVEFGNGDEIFSRGGEGADLYIIEEGTVELRESAAVPGCVVTLGRGEFFGLQSLLDDKPRSFSARASSNCRLLRIDRESFELIAHVDPEVPLRMLRQLSGVANRFTATAARRTAALGGTGSGAGRPRLVHEDSGLEFPLSVSGTTTVGRSDPRTRSTPDVDLGPTESQPSTSRLHAEIECREGRFSVIERVSSSNGSWVNGRRLEPGIACDLAPGDEVRFARVKLRFLS